MATGFNGLDYTMPRGANPWVLALAIFVSLFGSTALGQQNETLADVLAHNSIPSDAAAIPRLRSSITSYGMLNDPHQFVIAYYLAREDAELDFPLFLSRLDKRTGEWRNAELKDVKVSDTDETGGGAFTSDCLGSVTDIQQRGDRYYLNLHWNPSAGCLLILYDDFTVDNSLPGWDVAFLKGTVLWEHNMVHFASTNPAQLWLYDLASRRSGRVYPQARDPLRDQFKRRLAAVIDQDKCRKYDWSCDPDQFSSDVEAVEVNEQTAAFAVQIGFFAEGFLTPEETRHSSAWSDDHYVYFYRLSPFA